MKSVIFDIHHHGLTAPDDAVTSFSPGESVPEGSGLLSVGLHPWLTAGIGSAVMGFLKELIVTTPRIVAVGETGIDRLRGASVEVQCKLFRVHVELSESLGLPLVIHCVRATDLILHQHKLINPRQHWAIHGFRGKPGEVKLLTSRGIFLSYGEKFNVESLSETPRDFILAETDEADMTAAEIISRLEPFANPCLIAENSERFLSSPLNKTRLS
ncbi:MAG: TatD family hydrolase [Muribaculaceae bacterium]|nr:TatD family hydrolase [Muribaculaceae bacterium]